MDISALSVWHVRSHQEDSYNFKSRVTVITGANGSGKTTLLEAIYIALRGTSFRGTDSEFLRADETWWRVDIMRGNEKRSVKFDSQKQSGRKRIEINEATHYRMPMTKKSPVVLFEPEDLRLLNGSPSRRRDFIDAFISQVYPHYSAICRKYDRALKQRNTLLKQDDVSRDDLFVWDVALAEYGAEIISHRVAITERINSELERTYRSIADVDDKVSVHYSNTMIDSINQKLLNELHGSFNRDRILGYTTIGPHRHDIKFLFNHAPALSVASRGEVRSIILALKFIEVDVTTESTGQEPVILLDDVFAELDEKRQRRLAEKCRDNQMFITSTSAYTGIDTESVISLD